MALKENLVGKISIDSTVDHSANQYKFCTAAGALAASNGADALGVLQDAIDGSTNGPKPMAVGYLGVSKVWVNANSVNISIGDYITTDSGGIGVTKTFSATDIALGIALEASTADGDLISVLLIAPTVVVASQSVGTISGLGATRTLLASESGKTVLLDRAAGIVIDLPAPVIGLKYHFLVSVDLTAAAYQVDTDAATTFLLGSLIGAIEGAATDETHFADGTTNIGLSMNKTTTGGLIGGHFTMECINATQWKITGNTSCTATPATPFTT